MSTIRLKSVLEIIGVNPYVIVSEDEASLLREGWRGPMPVRFIVNGDSSRVWRINMMPVGDGSFRLFLHGDIRNAADVHVGDVLRLEVRFDDKYRGGPQHPMPPWFSDALGRSPRAKRGWERLTPSRQKEILRYFARLKSDEAKRRNVRRALHVLAGGEGRFMGRTWSEGK